MSARPASRSRVKFTSRLGSSRLSSAFGSARRGGTSCEDVHPIHRHSGDRGLIGSARPAVVLSGRSVGRLEAGAIIMDEHQSPGSDHRSSTKGTTGRAAVCSCCPNARDTEWNCRRKSGNRSGLSIEAIILSYLLFICDHQPSPPFIRKLTHQMFVK